MVAAAELTVGTAARQLVDLLNSTATGDFTAAEYGALNYCCKQLDGLWPIVTLAKQSLARRQIEHDKANS